MSGPMRLTTHRRSNSPPLSAFSDSFELMPPRSPSIAARLRNLSRSLRSPRSRARNLVVALAVFFLLVFYLSRRGGTVTAVSENIAKSFRGRRDFKDYEAMERQLPQHNADLPPPAGRNGRYVRFRNQVYGLGWNNILQEILLNTHVAHKSGRSYVFIPFHAAAHPVMGTRSRAPWIPLSAFMNAPTAGGPWPPGDKTPRAVTEQWYETVCPQHERVTLDTETVAGHLKDSDAQTLIDFWSKKLGELEERCVEIGGWEQIFNFYLTGSPRVLTAFKEFSTSATLKMFKWSELVIGAVQRNFKVISPPGQRASRPYVLPADGPIDGLLAMHVRRGDYAYHCDHFANWSSTYTSWAHLPQLPDRFVVPKGAGQGQATEDALTAYRRVCWPSNKQIVERARLMRQLHNRLDRVYILTNGKADYLAQLKKDLSADGWAIVSTSRDMQLNWQETWVSQTVDMAIAQRAEVFVGNGFSTLSANVALLRLTAGMSADTIRFW